MNNAKFEDRRIFARFPVKVPARVLDLGSNKESLAQAQDISAKGIGIMTDEELLPHTPLEMWLDLPNGAAPVYVRGEVVWSKMVESNKYRQGIDLEKANPLSLSRVLRIAAA